MKVSILILQLKSRCKVGGESSYYRAFFVTENAVIARDRFPPFHEQYNLRQTVTEHLNFAAFM